MNLFALLDSMDYQILGETKDKEIKSLAYHSKDAREGSVFFALEGRDTDGKLYMPQAFEEGCDTFIVGMERCLPDEAMCMLENGKAQRRPVTFIKVKDVRTAMAQMAVRFYGHPSKDLLTIGITGTKGKTSTAYMIWRILEDYGIKTGIIGTIFTGYEGNLRESSNTTPQSVEMQKTLRMMADAGCKAAVMEVSSQGLMQRRTDFMDFDIGVFTNLSPDHIGYGEHQNYEEYRYWKSMLFKQCKTAVMNIDDSQCNFMADASDAEKIFFYGKDEKADFAIDEISLRSEKGSLGVQYLLKAPEFIPEASRVIIDMPGEFNAYNSAAALAISQIIGISWQRAVETVRNIKIPGRAETVPVSEDFTVMVDYAHNGKALASLLYSLRQYQPERLIVVFGCGGNRAEARRIEMGKAASQFADVIIVTSDNPRNEDPIKIIEDIIENVSSSKEVIVIPDRKEAIREAIKTGRRGDIIVVAGKGHETYQIIGDEIKHFDDREEILSLGRKRE